MNIRDIALMSRRKWVLKKGSVGDRHSSCTRGVSLRKQEVRSTSLKEGDRKEEAETRDYTSAPSIVL